MARTSTFAPPMMMQLAATVLLIMIGHAAVSYSRVAPKPISVQGKLVYKDAHVRDIWTIDESGTDVVYKLPGQPQDSLSRPIPATSIIRLLCTQDPDMPTRCSKVSKADILRVASPVQATEVSIQLLVMVLSYTAGACGARAGADVDAVRDAYNSELGYANFLSNCSYGKLVYSNITVISTPVPCTRLLNDCDEEALISAARSFVIRQNGSAFFMSFSRYTYVVPTGYNWICGWVGLAEIPGSQTWYTPDEEGVFNKGTVLQESLHNSGIFHGWRNGLEYQDNSTAMGLGDSCPSAPELWHLGWASVIDLLNSSNFPVRTYKTYTLPATYVTSEANMVKIQPDWLPKKKYKKNVYMALRMRGGGDMSLPEEFNGKVNVHELNKDIDNSFTVSGDPRSTLVDTIEPSSFRDMSAYKLYVITGVLIDTNITIKICRYDLGPSECRDIEQ